MVKFEVNGTLDATYVYDDAGNRVQETNNTNDLTTFYLTDNDNPTGYAQPIEAWTSSSGTLSSATLTHGYIIGGRVIAQTDGQGNITYLLTDPHGSTRTTVNSTGTISTTFNYNAFGGAIGFTPSSSTPIFLFGGDAVYDPISGLYMNGDGVRERLGGDPDFIEANLDGYDSMIDPTSLNNYIYVEADPVEGRDPSGLLVESEEATVGLMALVASIVLPSISSAIVNAEFIGLAVTAVSLQLVSPPLGSPPQTPTTTTTKPNRRPYIMRLQLQENKLNGKTDSRVESQFSPITKLQIRNDMISMYNNPPFWFLSGTYLSSLKTAIVNTSQWMGSLPPSGISTIGNVHREQIPSPKGAYRLDLENLVGTNLLT